MVAIEKIPCGAWRAVIKQGDRVVATKCFKRKTHARDWARRIEGDRARGAALG